MKLRWNRTLTGHGREALKRKLEDDGICVLEKRPTGPLSKVDTVMTQEKLGGTLMEAPIKKREDRVPKMDQGVPQNRKPFHQVERSVMGGARKEPQLRLTDRVCPYTYVRRNFEPLRQ